MSEIFEDDDDFDYRSEDIIAICEDCGKTLPSYHSEDGEYITECTNCGATYVQR